ncbi:MAG: DUF2786 domain-containing protein [Acidimicrobiales bacterium]
MRSVGAQAKVLDRVRALLAKAESTTFEAEAQAFTAKAQELMTLYALDDALLEANAGGQARPGCRQVAVNHPYAGAKAVLLSEVATANRCKAVWSSAVQSASVIGFDADLAFVDILYTSLLVQATAAMTAAGSQSDPWGRPRTRSFRQAFLTAFASRIGQRLRESDAAATEAAAAEAGPGLLPVLVARCQAVERACEDAFPGLRRRTVTASNASGWTAGVQAADLSRLATRSQMSPGGTRD